MANPSVWSEVRPATPASLLRSRAAERGERTAFVFLADGEAEGERLTYAGLDARARAIAAALRESLAPGDRALLLYPPGLEFIAAFFGCLYAGVIAVPASPPRLRDKPGDRTQERLRAIARDAEPRAALTTGAIFAAAAARVPELAAARWIATDALEGSAAGMPEPDPASVAFLQYTSGSTAAPKGVMVTHANLLHNERMIGAAFRLDESSVVVGWLPLYHDMGLIGNVLQPVHAGGSCVLMAPVAFLQKPLRWLQAIDRWRGTTSGGPNFAYELCLRKIGEDQKAGLDLSSWRVAFNGAEPVRAETLERFAEAFAPCGFRPEAFYPCYGLAEATLLVSGGEAGTVPRVAQDEEERRLVSCGHAWAEQRIAVVDPETGEELPAGRVGEIWVAGPSVAAGYWRNPEATARDFQARLLGGEGPFLRTGDLGFLRDGELYVTGRIKDLVIIRGRNHYPQDIERTAEGSHPDLLPGSGAAFSVEVGSEERLVLVQEVDRHRKDGLEEIASSVRRAVAEEHEVQVHEVVLVRVGTVPKTSSGKIQRRATRDLYLAGGLAVVGRSAVAADAVPEAAVPVTVPSRAGLAALEPAERRSAVERFLRERAAAAVGVAPEAIDPRTPLTGLGLDSLSAVELKAAVESGLGVPLPLADLLEGAGTAELAAALLPALEAEPSVEEPALRAGGAELGPQPLSFGQKALWFIDRLAPEGGAYNVAVAARARGLDPAALRRALTALALRHPALRSVFPEVEDGEPVRRVLDHPEIDFAVEEAAGWSEARLLERLADEAYRPFDLGRGVVRVRVLRREPSPPAPLPQAGEGRGLVSPRDSELARANPHPSPACGRGAGGEGSTGGEQILLLAVHHIAVDFASLAVVARDLAALYHGEKELEPLPFGYSDFVRWQDETIAGPRGERLWAHWREALTGLPDLDLPTDRPRPPVQTYRGGARTLELPPELADGLRTLAAGRGATLFMALLAVFQTQLARYSGQEDFAVGSPSAGRPPELAGAVGYFVNPVALRADLAGEPGLIALLGRTRRTVLAGLEHADFPFALLAERLRPARDPARTPLFQVMFLLQRDRFGNNRPGDPPGLATFALGESGGRLDLGPAVLESLRLEERRAQFDLTLRAAEEAGGRLRASLEFNADLFDGETAERMLGHFRTLLLGAVERPEEPVWRLPLLTPAERAQALAWTEAPAEHRRDALLHGLFEEQAARTPEAEALVAGSERLTYAELNHRANQLAQQLRSMGVKPETRVGVRLGRSADLVVSLLGVLKAGGAYVPLDPKYPEERLALMLADSGARVLVTPSGVERHRSDRSDHAGPPLPGNLAYLIYTSGSTGRPKAVAVEHRSAASLVQWARGVFPPGELAGVLASTSVAFDLSVFEIFVPLAWGGRVILAENALELPRLPAAGEVSLVNTVPSALAELLRGGGLPPSVRTVNLAGEPIPPALAEAVHGLAKTRQHAFLGGGSSPLGGGGLEQGGGQEGGGFNHPESVRGDWGRPLLASPFPNHPRPGGGTPRPGASAAGPGEAGLRLFNLYGPSEDTTYSTWALIAPGADVTIGRPVEGTRAYVLDARGEPVPVGVPGELFLGGGGLARGYLDRPELTAERFVPDPWGQGERLYRTGDLVRRRVDGDLDFLGRIDHQVKIRGFRVELGEVEAALSAHPAVREAVVLALPAPEGGQRLAAYVVPREGAAAEPAALRAWLQERLPEAFLPSGWSVLEALPLSPNGKVDRKALARLAPRSIAEIARSPEDAEPRTPVERELAALIAEALGVVRVGRHDDFFALGGHSLLAARVASRASRRFGVDLPVSALFQAPTAGGLAGRIAALAGGAAAAPAVKPVLRPHEGREDLPLTSAQQRLWFLDRLQPGGAAYNMPGAAELEGALDVTALTAALTEAVRRHEALRTRFVSRGGTPVQVVDPPASVILEAVDLAGLPDAEREAAERMEAEAARPFDLGRGPLLRATLLRLAPERHRLLLTLHHMGADGGSLGILLDELAALYGAFAAGRPSPLAEPPVQYADFAVWQRDRLAGEALDRQLAWWTEELAGAPTVLDLPMDRPRPAARTQRGGVVRSRLPAALAEDVRALARQRGATPFMALLAAFQALLGRVAGQDDLLVGTVVAGRTRPEIEGLIGFFANTLVLRGELKGAPSFLDLLEQARRRTAGAWAHQDLPVERLVEALQPDREPGVTPLFQAVFLLQSAPAALALPGLDVRRLPVASGAAKWDLTLELTEEADGLAAAWELSRDVFDEPTVARLAHGFASLLAGAAETPERRLAELPLLAEAELRQLLESRVPRPSRPPVEVPAAFAAPRTPAEEILAAVWAEVLGVERVGVHDNFFYLGGHSLLASRIVSRIAETLGADLPLAAFFEAPTVAGLAGRLPGSSRAETPPLVPVPRGRPLPLSFAQERLWFLDRLAPGGAAYNLAVAALLEGDLDGEALERSLGEIVRRHEALRTVFAVADGRPVQVVQPWEPPAVERRVAASLEEARAEAARDAARPFDLAAGPVSRFALTALGPREHMLSATFHHIAADGWSLQVFLRELAELYGAFAVYGADAGREPALAEPPVQFADYAVWQREALSGEALDRPLAFWRQRLAGLEPVELPVDGPRTPAALAPARTHPLDLPEALAAGAAALARASGATPFMVLLAGVYALLARLTGQRDLTVGAPEAARRRVEIEGLIGFFVNTLPLRADLGGDPPFEELVARARSAVLAAHAHGGVPFERLVEELQPERAPGRNPLFDVMLAYLTAPPGWTDLPGLRLRPVDLPEAEAQLDLAFTVHESAGSLAGTVTARGDLFTEATLGRMAGWLRTLLEGAVAVPATRLSALPLLSAEERAAVLAAGSTEGGAWEPVLLHHLFEESARRAPEAPAAEMEGTVLSYGRLNARADRLARRLRALGVGPEVPVAVLLERSPALLVSLIAVLKAGGVYQPVDPEYPPSRIAILLGDSGVRVLVSGRGLPEGLAPAGAAVLRLDEIDLDEEMAEGAPVEPVRLDPLNLAYLYYTSGSTGRPKGVAVAHGPAAAHVRTAVRVFGVEPGARVLLFASPSFDSTVEQILPALAVGGTVVIRGRALWEPAELAAKIEETRLTWLDLPTAYWSRWAREAAELGEAPASLRAVSVGGEEMLPESARAWRRSALAGVRLINAYGPTEALVTATMLEVGQEVDGGGLTIGGSLPGRSAWVLDADGNLLPDGATGELALGGLLARGYLGAPDRTAERFVPDPFSGEPGARLYRSGDRVRRRPSGGALEFHGRVDTQVKIRGFRIEPGEIEALLITHPDVREAAVGVVTESGDPRLAAWVSLNPTSEIQNPKSVFRPFLAERLPEWMIPKAYTVLPELPLTPNGKIDRRALPRPSFEAAGEDWVAPRNPLEEALAAVWSQVLGIERVGAHDDFFHLGGHSLLATQLAARIRTTLGAELPLSDLFEAPTLSGMAARVEAARSAGRETLPPVVRRPHPGGVAPLSFAQQRLWFLHQLEPDSPAYHVPGALHLAGALRPDVLERALGEIVRRHEALRTVFADTGAGPVQRVLPAAPIALPRVDLRPAGGSALRPAFQEIEAERLARAEALRPFDLAAGPLLRTLLLRLADEEHLLVVVMHHVVSDGWSVGLMTGELAALYAAFAAGAPSPLPVLPVQYADFAEWQRRTLRGPLLERQLAWWRGQLADAPVLDLPADRPRPAVPSGRGGNLPVALPEELARGLRALARAEGVTLYMILLAAFATLLGRASGEEDLTVGSPIAGRDREEIEPLIGCFLNTLALRVRMAGDPGFRELLARVRETTLGAYDHQGVPFERLVEELAPGRDRARTPLFQVLLVLQNAPQPPLSLGDLVLAERDLTTGTAKFDLTLSLAEEEGGIAGGLEYSADLFEAATVGRWMGHLAELLRGAAADPGRALSALPLLTAAEHAQLLAGPAADAVSSVRASLPRLFEEQVDRAPDAPAVSAGGRTLTYRELDERANRLARHLRAAGVRPGDRVALCLDRSLDLVAALLAVLKAGAAYLPLDPASPAERLAFALEDSGAALLAAAGDVEERLPRTAVRTLLLNREADAIDRRDGARLGLEIDPGMPAYVIYTSGSTGRPKGVVVPHGNVSRLFSATAPWFGFGEDDVWTLFHSYAFDFSVWEIWGALLHGGRLVVVPYLTSRDPEAFWRLLEEEGVTVLNQTPSAFQQLGPHGGEGLRLVLFGGEALDPSTLAPWFERHGDVRPRLVNMYGITETTVHVTYRPLTRADVAAPGSPVGEPIPDLTLRVVDRQLGLQPWGFPGEICVGGEGLAQGYLGRPELTAERFVPDPWGPPGARLYRSGDLARRRPDGELDYLGRIDHQVKIRGFRIEPGEVEAALARHPAVRRAVVLPRESEGGRLLAACVVLEEPIPDVELQRFLRRSLPEHMVPAAFVALPDLPLTPNGKVDRRALERLRLDAAPGAGTVAPRTPAEELLAALWCEVLGRERVGVHDSFFELGGHSLLATRLVSRVRAAFGRDLPLARLFEAPTVAGLASFFDEARGHLTHAPIRPVPREGDLPLSFAQERLWFLDRIQPDAAYSVPLALRLHGTLDVARLARAFGSIVKRQEALRTVFVENDGEPAQRILHPPESWLLPVVDLEGLGRTEEPAAALAEADTLRPFDLAAGPLLRTTLLRLGAADHLLLLGMHHVVADGWSLGVLLQELAAFYGGTPGTLPELPVQPADFAVWQRDRLRGEELERQTAYWRRQLAGAPAVLDLPTDRPRPLLATRNGARRPVSVSPALTSRLAALGREQGATPFMLLLAAWAALLHRFSRQEDLNVGTPIAGRNRAEIEPLVGFFVNTLVMRVDLADDPPFPELMAQVRRTALAAYEHQDLPFEKLVDELRPERATSHQPLFQVVLALQNAPLGALELPGLTLEPVEPAAAIAKFDLTLELMERNGRLDGALEYNADLFDATTAARLVAHWGVLLEGIAAEPGRRVSELPLLTAGESHQLLVEWSAARPEPRGRLLHALVERHADATPEAPAVEQGETRWSYGELERRANRLAWFLRELGVGPETRVALCVERSIEAVAAMLGVLKAGGAYLPLDPAYPRERLAFMLEDGGARVLLTEERLLGRLPPMEGRGAAVVCLDRDADAIARYPPVRPAGGVTGQNAAYVIYTSGSTGRPKGVLVPHECVTAYCEARAGSYGAGPGDRSLLISSISFDASIEEIYVPLTQGATLLVRGEVQEGISELLERCRAERITQLKHPTALWHQLATAMETEGLRLPEGLRLAFVYGEKMLAQRLVSWWRLLPPGFRLLNGYGPTETTVVAVLCAIPDAVEVHAGLREVPIGRPLSHVRAYVVDRGLRPVPVGVVGELCLGGTGVSRGYLGRPELTAERFIPNPHAHVWGDPGERLYRTGDLVRLLPDGLLEFVGRTDHQVKIRGYRIEPGEIEAVLAAHPGLGEAVVLTRQDSSGDVRLAAYAAVKGETAPSPAELRAWLEERLPAYMVPADLHVLPALPVGPQGKVDRRALAGLAPRSSPPGGRAAFEPPRDGLEASIAEVWREVFGLEELEGDGAIGIHDNFFDAGGNSLLLVKLHSRLQKALGRSFPLVEIFTHPTIAALAASLGAEAPTPPSLDKARARTETRRESMRQMQQLREQRRRGR